MRAALVAAFFIVLVAARISHAQVPPQLGMSDDAGGDLREELDGLVPPGAPILQVLNVSYVALVATVMGKVQGPVMGITFAPQLSSPSNVCVVVVDIFTCVVTRNIIDSQSQSLTITAAGPRGNSAVVQALAFP